MLWGREVCLGHGYGFPKARNGALFKPGHLGLGDAERACHLHLGFAVVEPQTEDLLFPGAQLLKGGAEGDVLHPVELCIFIVPDLIHDGEGVAAVGVDGIVEADGGADGVQSLGHIGLGDLQGSADLLQAGLPAQGGSEGLLALEDLIGHIPDGPGHPDGGVVPEIAPDLSCDHGDAVGGKPHLLVGIKVADGLDEADAAHLEQVVGAFPPLVEALNHGQHQPEIPLDEGLSGPAVPLTAPAQQDVHLLWRQNPEACRVHAADLYFSLHGVPPCGLMESVFPGGRKKIRKRDLADFHKISGEA